jgi:hypothetical protein
MTTTTSLPRYANGKTIVRIECESRKQARRTAARLADDVKRPADGSAGWVAVRVDITPVVDGLFGDETTIHGVVTGREYLRDRNRGRRTRSLPNEMFRDGDSVVKVTPIVFVSAP